MAPVEARRADIVARARSCLGVRFRLHGRDPALGLDCVGLAAFAFGLGEVPGGYALRGGGLGGIVAAIDRAGLLRATGEEEAGDLLLLAAGSAQHHLAVWTGAGFVHADASLRRVVEVPGSPRWPLVARWRRSDLQE